MNRHTPFFDSDWHPADVQAALKKRGITMTGLAERHGYHFTAVSRATRQRWPEVQAIIAQALELEPQEIWPSRYHPDGTPIRYHPWSFRKRSTGKRRRNVYRGRAA